MSDDASLERTAAALRAAFDATFAAPARGARRDLVPLLAIRAGGEAVAVRLLETAGLLPAKAIVPAPSRRPEVLGVCGHRGAVLPVFSLARLLGLAEEGEAPRWMLLAGREERVALAFGALDGHLLVPPSALQRNAGEAVGHLAEVVEIEGAGRPVVSVPSVLRAVTGYTRGE
ncbi:chemotaxis protein CheW [Anaeromyxobacter sp. Fw109-5]|uniref:chemotaxis protein CheW n=1 Tax=Anaeromyxobacter sp. (strain Fw109-5) TaxID=404589 RepID=UPI000158A65A|nr:chemotaxis protein CheW [Anaeromyxobacter sp. Fw109-5]ABS26571.1 putative CheW protein [Anaeromyxobacter sp. Fw109-5]